MYLCLMKSDSNLHRSATGWRRPIGCLKSQVIFRKRAPNYKALLRKMTYEDKTSYHSTPPCIRVWWNPHSICICVWTSYMYLCLMKSIYMYRCALLRAPPHLGAADSYAQSHTATALHGNRNTLQQQHAATATHCTINTRQQQHAATATHCDSNTLRQQHTATATHCNSNTLQQQHTATATPCNSATATNCSTNTRSTAVLSSEFIVAGTSTSEYRSAIFWVTGKLRLCTRIRL